MSDQDRYSVFVPGETVDLCVPSALAIERDGWADWFNEAGTVNSLDFGFWPNSVGQQHAFLKELETDKSRLVLLICTKDEASSPQRALGVISLSSINMIRRSAEIALVLPTRAERPARGVKAPLRGLEAMALMTQHGFDQLGLERIAAGQVLPNQRGFNHKLELLSYRTEGVLRHAFAKGRDYRNVARIASLYDRYQALKQKRGGSLWLGNAAMHDLIQKLPKVSYADIVQKTLSAAEAEYFSGGHPAALI